LLGPTTILSFILATLFGAAFHLIAGGDARRLSLFLLAGWIGFGLGHVFGVVLGIQLMSIGTLRLLPAILGAVVALMVAHFLTNNGNKRLTR